MVNERRGLYSRLNVQKDVRDKEIKERDENTRRAIFNKSKEKSKDSGISQSRIDDLLGLTDTQRNKQGAEKISKETKEYIASVIKDRVDPMIICELADENGINLYDLIYLEYILPTDMKNYISYKQNIEQANELARRREANRRKEEELRKQREESERKRLEELERRARIEEEERKREERERREKEEQEARLKLSLLKVGIGNSSEETTKGDEGQLKTVGDTEIPLNNDITDKDKVSVKDETVEEGNITNNFLKKLKEVGKAVSEDRYKEELKEYTEDVNDIEEDRDRGEPKSQDTEVEVVGYTSDDEIDALIRKGKGVLTKDIENNKRKVYVVGVLEELGLSKDSFTGYTLIEMDTEGKFNNYLSNRESVMVLTRYMTPEVRDALSGWFRGLYDEDTGIIHDKYRVITVDDKDMQLNHDIIECAIPITKETLDEYYDKNPFDNYMKEKRLFPGLDSLL